MFEINYQQKIIEITHWIRSTIHNAGFSQAVIAISGGIDSAVVLALTAQALGKENVYAVLLPYGKFSNTSTDHGKLVCKAVGLTKDHIVQRDIQKVVNKIEKQEKISEGNNLRKGNIMARVRMIFLYDSAKEKNALVIGTENKSEYYLGYFTRFGDEASDIEPIRSFYKTQIWELGKVLHIPEEIMTKAPSAGLWDGQTDERELGFSYLEADKILYYAFEENFSLEAIVNLGFEKSLVEKVLLRVKANDFKHHLPHIFS